MNRSSSDENTEQAYPVKKHSSSVHTPYNERVRRLVAEMDSKFHLSDLAKERREKPIRTVISKIEKLTNPYALQKQIEIDLLNRARYRLFIELLRKEEATKAMCRVFCDAELEKRLNDLVEAERAEKNERDKQSDPHAGAGQQGQTPLEDMLYHQWFQAQNRAMATVFVLLLCPQFFCSVYLLSLGLTKEEVAEIDKELELIWEYLRPRQDIFSNLNQIKYRLNADSDYSYKDDFLPYLCGIGKLLEQEILRAHPDFSFTKVFRIDVPIDNDQLQKNVQLLLKDKQLLIPEYAEHPDMVHVVSLYILNKLKYETNGISEDSIDLELAYAKHIGLVNDARVVDKKFALTMAQSLSEEIQLDIAGYQNKVDGLEKTRAEKLALSSLGEAADATHDLIYSMMGSGPRPGSEMAQHASNKDKDGVGILAAQAAAAAQPVVAAPKPKVGA